jgi:hypothetical protein
MSESIFMQHYKGPFRGQFILRTFTAHFSVIRGAVEVNAFGPLDAINNYPRGSLALSATAVCATPYRNCQLTE